MPCFVMFVLTAGPCRTSLGKNHMGVSVMGLVVLLAHPSLYTCLTMFPDASLIAEHGLGAEL